MAGQASFWVVLIVAELVTQAHAGARKCVASSTESGCERRGAPNMREFDSHFVTGNRPVVYRGAAASDWPAMKWKNTSYLRDVIGEAVVEVEVYGPNNPEHDYVVMMENDHFTSLSLSEYLDHVESDTYGLPGSTTYHLAEMNLIVNQTRVGLLPLHTDVAYPYMFDPDMHAKTSLFMGNTTFSQMHYHTNNEALLVQLVSRKTVLIMPPNASSVIKAAGPGIFCNIGEPTRFQKSNHVQMLMNHPDAVVVDLYPGDVLYIPWLWWHATWTQEGAISMSVTHFWRAELSRRHHLVGVPHQKSCVDQYLSGQPFHGGPGCTWC